MRLRNFIMALAMLTRASRALANNNSTNYKVAAFASRFPTALSFTTTHIRLAFGGNINDSTRARIPDRNYNAEKIEKCSSNKSTADFDLLVIGAGSGGIASARRAASYGAKVAVVEKSKFGGTCINVGCVPKKIMWNAASIAETLHEMHHYGFSGGESDDISFDWKFIKEARDKFILRLNNIYERTMGNSGVQSIYGTASFVPNTSNGTIDSDSNNGDSSTTTYIEIMVTSSNDDNGEVTSKTYKANHVLIASGGRPTCPEEILGIRTNTISSDEFFELEQLPRKAVIIGAGYIAVELAGVLNSLGTETYLVMRHEKALRDFDDMLSETLDEEMTKQGIIVLKNSKGVVAVTVEDETNESGSNPLKTVEMKTGEKITGVDVVIVACGREPALEDLDLSNVGMELQPTGHIAVNEYSDTSVNGIYAVGDVCGNVELTPMAIAAGRRLSDRLFGDPQYKDVKVSYELVPTVVFTHPPIGTIGLSEKEALKRYGEANVKVYRSKFPNLYFGPWQVDPADKPKTAMKLICVGEEELVVGLHVIGMGADEMLQGFGIALKMGATKADFDSCIAIHPTAAEEFVTMFPWGLSQPRSGAKVSPLNGAAPAEPTSLK